MAHKTETEEEKEVNAAGKASATLAGVRGG
jgi:hypothetical protein